MPKFLANPASIVVKSRIPLSPVKTYPALHFSHFRAVNIFFVVESTGVITFVNCASVKWATRMQIVFTAAKMIAIVMLIVTGLVRLGQGKRP